MTRKHWVQPGNISVESFPQWGGEDCWTKRFHKKTKPSWFPVDLGTIFVEATNVTLRQKDIFTLFNSLLMRANRGYTKMLRLSQWCWNASSFQAIGSGRGRTYLRFVVVLSENCLSWEFFRGRIFHCKLREQGPFCSYHLLLPTMCSASDNLF